MPNKEGGKVQSSETKIPQSASLSAVPKVKVAGKEVVVSPSAPAPTVGERTELLGSLTTQQQQRTSARVIKKLRLEPPPDRDKRPEIPECETPNKLDEKDLKFPTVKQRMPKALWSTDEKNLFFEALNEYGKDFDAITSYICGKMKKKGMPDVNLKTKTQVSHFYYRTWHKLSKHVHFDENVKKVAQELYALINYGELRKKLVSVNEKTCARLGEMVLGGSMVVRARGRNLRVRTPMCRALRRLNQITELACGSRVCGRAQVVLRARDAGAWARVQAAAHNPRAALALPPRTPLAALLSALTHRWRAHSKHRHSQSIYLKTEEAGREEEYREVPRCELRLEREDLAAHLNLEPERMLVQEQRQSKKLALHVGPRPEAEIHLPLVSPSEQLSSQKICFSSYLERMGSQRRDKDSVSKIRTPKRQRKDSTTDKETEQKKFKMDDHEPKLMNIEETAIDGIELMASYKHHVEDEEKPSTEDEKELKSEETAEEEGDNMPERDKDMSEREKDSFSEMEDDEKFNKSDTDNESDQGKSDKGTENKFKNLKVKFRLHPKKRGGSIYTLVMDNQDEPKIDDAMKQEDDPAKPEDDPAKPEDELAKPDDEPARPDDDVKTEIDVDVEMALRQIRKGWSIYDVGDLTVGDLYLMFGSRSKLELDYWWAEPTPPLPQPAKTKDDRDRHIEKREKAERTPDKGDSSVEDERGARESDNDIFSPKNTFSQDSNDGLSGDERKCEQLASPEHKSAGACGGSLKLLSKLVNRPLPPAPPANHGFSLLSERLKRLLALAGNAHVAPLAAALARCHCGHVCEHAHAHAHNRKQPVPTSRGCPRSGAGGTGAPVPGAGAGTAGVAGGAAGASAGGAGPGAPVFRHPPPIAPRPQQQTPRAVNLEGLPRWRRRVPSRVVVQRLLPLLPKLPPPTNLIPVKIVPNSPPPPPKILPKPPPPTTSSDMSFFYVLSESNGQFYFHDGDRRIPITIPNNGVDAPHEESEEEELVEDMRTSSDGKSEATSSTSSKEASRDGEPAHDTHAAHDAHPRSDGADLAHFLPSESMSLSPSRLLRDAEGWLEGSVQDFSLSSFLGHLEGRPQPDLAVDSQLQSLMAESSVDYVAKFADLAAEVTDEALPLQNDDLT